MLHLHNSPLRTPELRDEFRFIHEWFAGWRWECHRRGELLAESQESFESREECVADAKRRAARDAVSSDQASGRSEQHEVSELAA